MREKRAVKAPAVSGTDAASAKAGENTADGAPAPRKNIITQIFLFFFPIKTKRKQSRRTKVSVVIYVLLLIITSALLVFAATALVIQANRVLAAFPRWLKHSDYVSVIVTRVRQVSVHYGGLPSFCGPDHIHHRLCDESSYDHNKYASRICNGRP